jgi:regulator of ribonuclease activity A
MTAARTIPTCDLCDAYKADASGAFRVVPPVFQSYGGVAAFSGPVRTVRCFEDNSLVKAAVESPGAGQVLVVDGGGSLRRALVGGNLAVLALALVPMAGERRGEGQADTPVTVAGVTVHPGDWLVADADGVVVMTATIAAAQGLGVPAG